MKNKFLWLVAFLGLLAFPINTLTAIILCLFPVVVSAFIFKDKNLTANVLKPGIAVGIAFAVKGFFEILSRIILNFAQLSDNYYTSPLRDFMDKFTNILDAVILIAVLVFAVLLFISFITKKDILFNKLSNKFTDELFKNREVENNNVSNITSDKDNNLDNITNKENITNTNNVNIENSYNYNNNIDNNLF